MENSIDMFESSASWDSHTKRLLSIVTSLQAAVEHTKRCKPPRRTSLPARTALKVVSRGKSLLENETEKGKSPATVLKRSGSSMALRDAHSDSKASIAKTRSHVRKHKGPTASHAGTQGTFKNIGQSGYDSGNLRSSMSGWGSPGLWNLNGTQDHYIQQSAPDMGAAPISQQQMQQLESHVYKDYAMFGESGYNRSVRGETGHHWNHSDPASGFCRGP